jgi:hypothetical protein
LKFIAYSLFGQVEKYRVGLLRNLEIAPLLYPDWTCLVYCDERNFQSLMELALPHARFILQDTYSHELAGAAWRLNACTELGAEAIIFRDTDSLLGEREKAIVDSWLSSGHDVHLIRDHPLHFSPVMAGMFGVKGEAVSLLARMVEQYLGGHRQHVYGDDQVFLNKHFYPKIKHQALVHTTSVRYLFEYTQPIRACREDELFIGAYEFACPSEQAGYIADRLSTPGLTRLPYSWRDKRLLKLFFNRLKITRINYGCLWCL